MVLGTNQLVPLGGATNVPWYFDEHHDTEASVLWYK